MGDMTVDELKDKKLWFLWSAKPGKNGKVTKVPFAANGGATGTDDAHKGTWVSFDDAELQDSSTSIQLVTAVHPKYQLGRITAKHLLRMMDDTNWQQKNYSYRFPVKIKDGNSVRKI
mgnify:FL=1